MENNEYATTDLYFAAYLQCAGVPMKRTDKLGHGPRLNFVFASDLSNIDELKNAWYSKTGKVSALDYANTIKSLKNICHMP